jgi:hypothetical protein
MSHPTRSLVCASSSLVLRCQWADHPSGPVFHVARTLLRESRGRVRHSRTLMRLPPERTKRRNELRHWGGQGAWYTPLRRACLASEPTPFASVHASGCSRSGPPSRRFQSQFPRSPPPSVIRTGIQVRSLHSLYVAEARAGNGLSASLWCSAPTHDVRLQELPVVAAVQADHYPSPQSTSPASGSPHVTSSLPCVLPSSLGPSLRVLAPVLVRAPPWRAGRRVGLEALRSRPSSRAPT